MYVIMFSGLNGKPEGNHDNEFVFIELALALMSSVDVWVFYVLK